MTATRPKKGRGCIFVYIWSGFSDSNHPSEAATRLSTTHWRIVGDHPKRMPIVEESPCFVHGSADSILRLAAYIVLRPPCRKERTRRSQAIQHEVHSPPWCGHQHDSFSVCPITRVGTVRLRRPSRTCSSTNKFTDAAVSAGVVQ